MSIYKQAMRAGLRFEFKGLRSTEELWGLTVEELDYIFQNLGSQKQLQSRSSLLSTKTKESSELDLKIEIVKDIVNTLLQEKDERQALTEKAVQRHKVLEALARKKEDALENMSLEDLEALAAQI